MKNKYICIGLLIALPFLVFAQEKTQDKVYEKPELRSKLLQMMQKDQDARSNREWDLVSKLDREHAQFLEHLIESKQWPKISEVGKDAAKAAWLLAQHADHDLELQKSVLKTISSYRFQDEANPQDVALLTDRIAVSEKRMQIYGTQGRCVENEGWQPNDILNPLKVELLRNQMGLMSFKDYIEKMQQFC